MTLTNGETSGIFYQKIASETGEALAHVTPDFRNQVLIPSIVCASGAAICFEFGLMYLGDFFAMSFRIWPFLIPFTAVSAIWSLREFYVRLYRKNIVPPGVYQYVIGAEPSKWHRKMGALWVLERLTSTRGKRALYRRLGAKFESAALAGLITDPELFSAGQSVVLGEGSCLATHVIETVDSGLVLHLAPIHIGDRSVVGINAVLLPGVVVESHVTVPACSVIAKGRRFPSPN